MEALSRPNPVEAAQLIVAFDGTQSLVESALTRLIQHFPDNTRADEVLLKVVTLNTLYLTNILAIYPLAEHIQGLGVDAAIRSGDAGVVEAIARLPLNGKVRRNYSFATKYCAWHNPTAYPIYDWYVEAMLWEYQRTFRFAAFRRQDLSEYPAFRKAVLAFRSHFGLDAYSLKEIDKVLWVQGKRRYIQKQEDRHRSGDA